jgi:hypothetical protein
MHVGGILPFRLPSLAFIRAGNALHHRRIENRPHGSRPEAPRLEIAAASDAAVNALVDPSMLEKFATGFCRPTRELGTSGMGR